MKYPDCNIIFSKLKGYTPEMCCLIKMTRGNNKIIIITFLKLCDGYKL